MGRQGGGADRGGCGCGVWVWWCDARMQACHCLKPCGCFDVLLAVLDVTKHVDYVILHQLLGTVSHLAALVEQHVWLCAPGVSCLVVGVHVDNNRQCPPPDRPLLDTPQQCW